ncbi:hypothetical protein EON65_44705 [archaeon]|nr:MAG: hypothetical protein EON65_44705 [archaeon]
MSFESDNNYYREVSDITGVSILHGHTHLDITSDEITEQSHDRLYRITKAQNDRAEEDYRCGCVDIVLLMDSHSLVKDPPHWIFTLTNRHIVIWVVVLQNNIDAAECEFSLSQALSKIRAQNARTNPSKKYLVVASSVCCNGLLRWLKKAFYHSYDCSLYHTVLIAPVIIHDNVSNALLSQLVRRLWSLGHCHKLAAWKNILSFKPCSYLYSALIFLLNGQQCGTNTVDCVDAVFKHIFVRCVVGNVSSTLSALDGLTSGFSSNLTVYMPSVIGDLSENVRIVAGATTEVGLLSYEHLYNLIHIHT